MFVRKSWTCMGTAAQLRSLNEEVQGVGDGGKVVNKMPVVGHNFQGTSQSHTTIVGSVATPAAPSTWPRK